MHENEKDPEGAMAFEEDKKFDYEDLVRQLRLGYPKLMARLEEVRKDVERLLLEEQTLIRQVASTEKMLSAAGHEPKVDLSLPQPKFKIAEIAIETITKFFQENPGAVRIGESKLIELTKARIPQAKEESIQKVLAKLAKDGGKLSRYGRRGSFEYSFSDVEIPGPDLGAQEDLNPVPAPAEILDLDEGKVVSPGIYLNPHGINPDRPAPPS